MSTVKVTRAQFEYSIVAEFSTYSDNIADRLLLTEVGEQELRKFKTLNVCVNAIRDYFSKYTLEVAPSGDKNMLTQSEIESVVRLYNALMETNYWYEFPDDAS